MQLDNKIYIMNKKICVVEEIGVWQNEFSKVVKKCEKVLLSDISR